MATVVKHHEHRSTNSEPLPCLGRSRVGQGEGSRRQSQLVGTYPMSLPRIDHLALEHGYYLNTLVDRGLYVFIVTFSI